MEIKKPPRRVPRTVQFRPDVVDYVQAIADENEVSWSFALEAIVRNRMEQG